MDALDNSPATVDAQVTMARRDIDLSLHLSRELNSDQVLLSDEVFCMEERHRLAAVRICPEAESRIRLLDPAGADVEDPIGQGRARYEECARLIEGLLRQRLGLPSPDDR